MEEISIILCSRDKDLYQALYENIKTTVGCDFEIFCIDNSSKEYSIFQAYNLGISRARNNILIFVHEDALFHTLGWGKIIIDHFRVNPGFGLFGVAGSSVKTKTPSGWWDCPKENKYLNLIQHFPDGSVQLENIGFESPGLKDAVVVDGVFLALKKNLDLTFNENFRGFHSYDLNIGFEVLKKGFKIGVIDSILIEHFSYGHQNTDWLEAMEKVHHRYRRLLPLSIDASSVKKLEIINSKKFMMKCLEAGRKKWFYYYWLKLVFLNPVYKLHYELAKRIFK